MKQLTNQPQLKATLGIIAAHAAITSFGAPPIIRSKETFMDLQKRQVQDEIEQSSFERISEDLYLSH